MEDFEQHMPKHKKDDLRLSSAGMVKKPYPKKPKQGLGESWRMMVGNG